MSNYETILSTQNASILGFVGAAVLGFISQMMLNMLITDQLLLAFLVMVVYAVILAGIEYICKTRDCKWACQFNEFWIVIIELVKRKIKNGNS